LFQHIKVLWRWRVGTYRWHYRLVDLVYYLAHYGNFFGNGTLSVVRSPRGQDYTRGSHAGYMQGVLYVVIVATTNTYTTQLPSDIMV